MKASFARWLMVAASALTCTSVSAQSGASESLTYKTSLKAILELGRAIQAAIKPEYQNAVQGQPISITTDDLPFVRLKLLPDDPKPLPIVEISQGFIDLINNVAHAKAIDGIERGYFERYVLSLARESGEKMLKPLPNDSDKRFWTEDMINEQYSNFNSIVGMMIGIKVANHYLGHYKKYVGQMNREDGGELPINNFLTPKEWDEALKVGARNALAAGCTIEGALPFFQLFEKMPKRPAWTAFFVPDTAKYRDIRRTLEKLQRDFFSGKG